MRAIPGRTYAQIKDGRIHWLFTFVDLPEWNEDDITVVDITGQAGAAAGMAIDNGIVQVPTPAQIAAAAAEAVRLAAIDAAVGNFVFGGQTINQLKAMDAAAFDTWWTANVTNLTQANQVLKLLARTTLRRVL